MADIDAKIDYLIFGREPLSERQKKNGYRETFPPFSSDINHAFRVASAMREKGFHFLLMISHESGLAIASFYLGPHDRSDSSCTERHDQVAMAICRAALKAVEVVV